MSDPIELRKEIARLRSTIQFLADAIVEHWNHERVYGLHAIDTNLVDQAITIIDNLPLGWQKDLVWLDEEERP